MLVTRIVCRAGPQIGCHGGTTGILAALTTIKTPYQLTQVVQSNVSDQM